MSAAAILTILRNGETVKSCPIEGDAVLGRADGCVIRLEDRAISRQHAVFRIVADGVQVERKSEFAPLMINGAEMIGKATVKEADVISIGPYLMRVTLGKVTVAEPTLPLSEPVLQPPVTTGDLPPTPTTTAVSLEMAPTENAGDGATSLNLSSEPDQSQLPPAEPGAELAQLAQGSDFQMEESHEEAADDAKTKLTPAAKISVHLVFAPGVANVTYFELTKDEVSIGRGKTCDIVLNDKKSSRKNSLIRRAGLKFTIKDLDSANGTFVNGVRVQEQELFGDDVVKVGGAEFQFKAMSADYSAREQDFLRVPEEPEEPVENYEAPFVEQAPFQIEGSSQVNTGALPGITGIGPGDVKHMDLIAKIKNFKTLPTKDKIIVAVIVLGLTYGISTTLLDEPEPEVKKVAKKSAVTAPSGEKAGLSFAQLSPEKKRFVIAQHALGFDYFKNKEYDKAIHELGKIFLLIQDYKDSREIERYAKEGLRKLEAFEAERRQKEEEVRLKAKIQQLVDECRERMAKKEYEQARELFAQISIMDPDNAQITAWKKEIEDIEEQKRLDEQSVQVQGEINQRAWEVYADGLALKKKGKYHSAIGVFGKVADIGASDKKVIFLAAKMIKASFAAIKAAREPLLAEARQLEASNEYPKAFALYKRATQVDPPHREGYAGMNRIRGILHDRAKFIYVEAILAESYSDFATAKKKFTECLEVAPVDDIYYERSKRKLAHYFRKEDIGP